VLAAEGLDALMPALAREPRRPDLIVCDYRLRGDETGLAVVAALQAEYNHDIPAILITGDTAPERLREAHRSALTLLHKPVGPAQLREAMDRLLAPAAPP
jgi:CheY-like chemotaxis protein